MLVHLKLKYVTSIMNIFVVVGFRKLSPEQLALWLSYLSKEKRKKKAPVM